jgi:GNAT superfamily N-acetyltransferase
VIRPFVPQDARPVAELIVRAWRWAYSDFVDDDRMPTVDDREARLSGAAADPGAAPSRPLDRSLWVWDQDGRVVGIVGASGAEIQLLYVDPPAQGSGVGSALLGHCVDALREAGHTDALLWVFEANGHGRWFYEQRGWRPDGTRQELWPGTFEVRYRREL